MKKSKLIGLSMTAVTLGVVGLAGLASAQSGTSGTGLIDKIATKFNLNKADVQAVFDADHTDKQATRLADKSAELQALVDKGTITAAQKTTIEAKQKELQTTRDTERTDLEKWATDNGVDMRYVMMHGPKDSTSSDRLAALVTSGKITADQKTKIEAKQAELSAKREAGRTALEKWATDNKIDAKYLMGSGMGSRGHGGHGGPGMGKDEGSTTSS